MRMWQLVMLSVLILAATIAVLLPDDAAPLPEAQAQVLDVAAALSADAEGYAQADTVRPFTFPADHGHHPGFRTEWWYLVCHLKTVDGRRFGLQLTIFRSQLTPELELSGSSAWRSNNSYLVHVASTDWQESRFMHRLRQARGAGGLAGVQADTDEVRVWLGSESLTFDAQNGVRCVAQIEGRQFDLQFVNAADPILHGDRGLSRKSHQDGRASYYYSLGHLSGAGTVTVDGDSLAVECQAWFDHEWMSSGLAPGQSGWDWCALHLDDGSRLMAAQVRSKDGSAYCFGTKVTADGRVRGLQHDQLRWQAGRIWEFEGGRYPVVWDLQVQAEDDQQWLGYRLEAVMDKQLHTGPQRYWEGVVTVQGEASGVGYVEMVGRE